MLEKHCRLVPSCRDIGKSNIEGVYEANHPMLSRSYQRLLIMRKRNRRPRNGERLKDEDVRHAIPLRLALFNAVLGLKLCSSHRAIRISVLAIEEDKC